MTLPWLVAAAFVWNFLTIASYSMVGPARGALLMADFGPATLPWVYLGSAALTGAVVWVYSRTARAPRRRLIGGWLVLLTLTLGGGAAALRGESSRALAFLYFLWTDVFGIMAVTLFWTYANDVFGPKDAPRAFGLIAAGSPLGAIAGAWLDRLFIVSHGPVAILIAASVVFAAVLPLFLFMEAKARDRGLAGAPAAAAAPPPPGGMLRTIASSRFLTFLTLIVALERMVPDFTNYLYSAAAAHAYGADARGMAAYFAGVNFWTSVASAVAGVILAAPALRTFGVGGCLSSAGLANLGLFLVFPFMPTLSAASVFFGLDGVTRYTWFKTAKETTYSSTDKDVVYRVKAFVEMFVYRLARGGAGFLLLAAAWLGQGEAGAAWLGAPPALLWVYGAIQVGREDARRLSGASAVRSDLGAGGEPARRPAP